MNEMIERVARAMVEALDPGQTDLAMRSPVIARAYFRAARAAIEAMRPLTAEQYRAAAEFDLPEEAANCVWQSMIDAGLTQESGQ